MRWNRLSPRSRAGSRVRPGRPEGPTQAANDDRIGTLRIPDGQVACRVVQGSPFGARLLVDEGIAVDREFELAIGANPTVRRARVVWRQGGVIVAELRPARRGAPQRSGPRLAAI